MSYTELMEGIADQALALSGDAIHIAVGCNHCMQYKLFDVRIDTPLGRSPRLRVSRYYWDLERPVAVDFVRELRFGEQEIAVKKDYFARQGARYILVRDAWDGEGAEAALARLEPEGDYVTAIQSASRPLLGPRRNKEAV